MERNPSGRDAPAARRRAAATTRGASPRRATATRPAAQQSGDEPVAAPRWLATIAAAAVVVAGSRDKYVEAFVGAGLESLAGSLALVERRAEILRDTFAELRAVGVVMRLAGPRESLAHLDDLARGAVELARCNVRDLARLAATTQKAALQILARRLQEDLNEFSRLRAGPSAPRSA